MCCFFTSAAILGLFATHVPGSQNLGAASPLNGPAVLASSTLAPAQIDCGGFNSTIDCANVSPQTDTFPTDNPQHSVSGKVLSLTVSADGQRLYAGTYSGVWRSDSSGAEWSPLTRPQPTLGENSILGALMVPTVFDVAVSPTNKDVVLAVTGSDTRVPLESKAGIYRSSDGGTSWTLVHQFRYNQETCKADLDKKFPALPVGQVVFARDDSNLVYAAGGCAIAKSIDGGVTWVDKPIPGSQERARAWHVVTAPQEGPIRRVYAAGDGKIFYSKDGGNTWFTDSAPIIPQMGSFQGISYGSVGGFPGGGGNSSQVLAVEPGHPDHVYVAVTNTSNGPHYYFASPDGQSCQESEGCSGAAVWLGNYSAFFQQGNAGTWRRLASPPAYYGGCQGLSTDSGRVYIVTKRTSSGYLLFLADNSHVHVSQGRPEQSALWHRLDGRDASQSKRDNQLCNELFVHADPMAIAVSQDFDITLKPSNLPPPFNQNSELDQFVRGMIWMGNDGGVFRSTDGGAAWSLTAGLTTLQPASKFAVLAPGSRLPQLFFGVSDNDDFFSPNGGETWQNDEIYNCNDCGPRFSDPAQPDRVLEMEGADRGGIAVNSTNLLHLAPFPVGFINESPLEAGFSVSKEGYRPIIFTLSGEENLPQGDYILIRQLPAGKRVLQRTSRFNEINTQEDWDTIPIQQGPDLVGDLKDVYVVQASGGHDRPVFYVGAPGISNNVWKWTQGRADWQQIVPSSPDTPSERSAKVARRFFVDPYDPKLIYIIDRGSIKQSKDGGQIWTIDRSLDSAVTENKSFSYDIPSLPIWVGRTGVINDMIFDREKPGMRFAVGDAGVFFTANGTNWERLLSTTALPGYPMMGYFDPITDPSHPALYVAMNGRGILRLGPIPAGRGGANLSITKTDFPDPVTAGKKLTYTVTVANNGPDTATSVTVTDNLPAETTFVSCSSTGGGVCGGSGNNRTVTFASLTSGESETITFVATVNCSVADGTVISNTATVSSSTLDPDSNNNSATATTTASNPPPTITGASANPSVLWPPNHKLENVTVNYNVIDNCPLPANSCTLSVTSNEPINGTGDGNTSPDWIILDAHHVQLRAERAGKGNGRVYAIGITCTDSGGNSSHQHLEVSVPHDQGRK